MDEEKTINFEESLSDDTAVSEGITCNEECSGTAREFATESEENSHTEIEPERESNPEESEKERTCRMFTGQEVEKLISEAYLRGRNEQITERFVGDTSQLAANDGVVKEDALGDDDASWIHTRSSVWK